MKVQFSEFAYGHAVITEFEHRLCAQPGEALIAAPDLPSLRHERVVGYDVKIDTNTTVVALQFKVGEYVGRRHPNSPTWHQKGLGVAHYRTSFSADDHQLDIMRALENDLAADSRRSLVAYIAPGFHTRSEFNQRYAQGCVVESSYGCFPSEVPCDGDDHHLAYVPGPPPRRTMFSEPQELKPRRLQEHLDGLADEHLQAEPAEADQMVIEKVPRAVRVTEETLLRFMSYLDGPEGFSLESIKERAAADFEGRPDLEHAAVAIEAGIALGVTVGFTATAALIS